MSSSNSSASYYFQQQQQQQQHAEADLEASSGTHNTGNSSTMSMCCYSAQSTSAVASATANDPPSANSSMLLPDMEDSSSNIQMTSNRSSRAGSMMSVVGASQHRLSQSQMSQSQITPPDLLTEAGVADSYHSMAELEQPPSSDDSQEQQRPIMASLGQFFREFNTEFKELVAELMEYSKAKTWKKKVMAVVLCVSSLLVFYDLFFGSIILQQLEHFILWMTRHSSLAVLAFVGIFVISTLIFIPPTLLIFGAGYAFAQAIGFGWGILAATLSCSVGSCIGASIAFARSRYMMRDLIYVFSKRYPLVRAADRALKRNGFHIMLLLRLCPLIPFNGLNYCCGITGVSLEDFTMGLIGILPFQVFTVIVGATTGTFALRSAHNVGQDQYSSNQEIGFVILIASGCAFGLIALVYIWKVVKQELRKELELTPEQFEACLHPPSAGEDEEHEQGGMEQSVEVSHLANDGESEQWMGDGGEEWFWVWA